MLLVLLLLVLLLLVLLLLVLLLLVLFIISIVVVVSSCMKKFKDLERKSLSSSQMYEMVSINLRYLNQ